MNEEPICALDFSDFKGEKSNSSFKVKIGQNESYPFYIEENLFENLYFKTLNYFYLSRCGENTSDSIFGHTACHTGLAEVYGTKEKIEANGGWHDAGDYGRYIVAGAKTVMDLLLAYEVSGQFYKGFDILSEVRFELEWMLKMQRSDGAVYHKISCYHFCGFIVPEKETDKLVIAPVSTAATADFAGCAAYASMFYKNIDSTFSETLLSAAVKAQDYLDSHDDEIYDNPPEIKTGNYGDKIVSDERYFALCSLFAATGKEHYLLQAMDTRKKAIEDACNVDEAFRRWAQWSESFGWGKVTAYGTEILLKYQEKIKDKQIVATLKNSIISKADDLLSHSHKNIFGTPVEHIFWGSNGHLSDESHILLLAYDLTGNKEYYDAAKTQFDYILGCNPMNLCYVTELGTNYTKKPHHRPSAALGHLMPGMLAGGPCYKGADELAKKMLVNKAPLTSYLDEAPSYSTNEVAIYWNSPFVYLTARVMAFEKALVSKVQ